MIIDPSSPLGLVRLRIADYQDIPYLNDAVIQSTLDSTNGNVPKAAKICATYILGMLAHKTHRKMAQLEVWGSESFENYSKFLMLTINNPAYMDLSPIPYSSTGERSSLLDFQETWNRNFYAGTEAQQAHSIASYSPNDGSKYGPFGGF